MLKLEASPCEQCVEATAPTEASPGRPKRRTWDSAVRSPTRVPRSRGAVRHKPVCPAGENFVLRRDDVHYQEVGQLTESWPVVNWFPSTGWVARFIGSWEFLYGTGRYATGWT